MMVAFTHAPLGDLLVFGGVVFFGSIGAVALVEKIWKIEDDCGTICFQVTDADTGAVLSMTLDESDWSETDKYRDAFEDALRHHPLRHIVVKRVPVAAWDTF